MSPNRSVPLVRRTELLIRAAWLRREWGRISLQSPSTGEVRRKAEVFGGTGKAEMFGETDDTTSALGGGQYLVALH